MRIAVAGGYGVGMTMKVIAAPGPGETVTGGELSIGHGGKGSNQAVAASRLGADVSLFTAVGLDDYGVAARQFWADEGIDSSAVVDLAAPTMTGFIVVDSAGENRIALAPGALADLTPAHAEGFRQSIKSADLFIVSMEIPLVVVIELLRIAKAESTKTLLNPAPATSIPAVVWPLVDILTPNETETATLLGDSTQVSELADQADRLHQLTGALVVLTAGERGIVVNDGEDKFTLEAFPIDTVRDTTGAGDAFTAALGVLIAEGRPLREAATFAAAAGALAVTRDGVIPALATRKELELFVNRTFEQNRGTS